MARRLNCHLPQVDRLLDLLHASRLDQFEAAFRVLGKKEHDNARLVRMPLVEVIPGKVFGAPLLNDEGKDG